VYGTKKVDLGGKGSFDVKKGALHRMLDIPEGQTIPPSRLTSAAHSSDPLERKRAISAEGLKAMKK
jgi:hypothetical protein